MITFIRTPLTQLKPSDTIGVRDIKKQENCLSCTVVMVDQGKITATPNHRYSKTYIFDISTGKSIDPDGEMEIFLTPNRRLKDRLTEDQALKDLKWD